MILKFGMYKGLELSQVPKSYLEWLIKNFDDGVVKTEAEKILNRNLVKGEEESKSLEEQANEILGEKPIGLIRRGRGRYKR